MHYAWIVMLGCFILQFASMGIFTNCSGLYTSEILQEFGFTNGGFSWSVTIRTLGSAISMWLCAKVYNKKSFKLCYGMLA